MEVFAAHAAMAGVDQETVRRVMQCINTTEAAAIIREQGMLEKVMKTITERIEFYLRQRAGEKLQIGMILFSLEDGILGKTEEADLLLEQIRQNQPKADQKE